MNYQIRDGRPFSHYSNNSHYSVFQNMGYQMFSPDSSDSKACGMNPKVGNSSPYLVEKFSVSKLRHFLKNIPPWVEQECCCLWAVNIWKVKFTNKNTNAARASIPELAPITEMVEHLPWIWGWGFKWPLGRDIFWLKHRHFLKNIRSCIQMACEFNEYAWEIRLGVVLSFENFRNQILIVSR